MTPYDINGASVFVARGFREGNFHAFVFIIIKTSIKRRAANDVVENIVLTHTAVVKIII